MAENDYVSVVNGRWQRELVLKLLSARDDDPIPLDQLADRSSRVRDPEPRRADPKLCQGGVLLRDAAAMYQFHDTRLRVYARLREPLTDEARRRWQHHESDRSTTQARS